MVSTVQRKTAHVNGIDLSYLSAGDGPLVILVHGFPDLAISWQHQFSPLADAGYHVVAPDMRGYGASSAPEEIASYSQFDLAGDLTGLMDELGVETAVLVGHDVGAGLAWGMAATLPHRIRAIVALSVPQKPRGSKPPVDGAPPQFYQRAFQQVGVEETDLDANVATFLPAIFDRLSGSSALGPAPALMMPEGSHFRDLFEPPKEPPSWLGEEKMAEYIETFGRTGFRGALNWYRNIDRNWHQMAGWAPGDVSIPAAYIVGTEDVTWGLFHGNGVIDSQIDRVPNLWESRVLDGVGHWTAQEAPDAVKDFLLEFLHRLDSSSERK
jgi:pimeloyl-ACP methyl ester carboxylesterase